MRTCSTCRETKQDACFWAKSDPRCVQCVGRDAHKYLQNEWQQRFKGYLNSGKSPPPPDSL